MISDEMAYWQYLDGKEESADILVERYGDALTYYINGYIHDIHESEDLMIEAFAQIFAKERPIDGKGSFRAYLYKTAIICSRVISVSGKALFFIGFNKVLCLVIQNHTAGYVKRFRDFPDGKKLFFFIFHGISPKYKIFHKKGIASYIDVRCIIIIQ